MYLKYLIIRLANRIKFGFLQSVHIYSRYFFLLYRANRFFQHNSALLLNVVTARLNQVNAYCFIANSGSLDCPGKAFWDSKATYTTSLFVEASQVYLDLHVEVVCMSWCDTELQRPSTILPLLSGVYT